MPILRMRVTKYRCIDLDDLLAPDHLWCMVYRGSVSEEHWWEANNPQPEDSEEIKKRRLETNKRRDSDTFIAEVTVTTEDVPCATDIDGVRLSNKQPGCTVFFYDRDPAGEVVDTPCDYIGGYYVYASGSEIKLTLLRGTEHDGVKFHMKGYDVPPDKTRYWIWMSFKLDPD
jgi:hypothetical protein